MPFPKQFPRPANSKVRIDVDSKSSAYPWMGFGSSAFSLSEPELVERPGRPSGKIPAPETVQELMRLSYSECGLTRARVQPFRYEHLSNQPFKPAKRWTAEDFNLRGVDRVMDYVLPARAAGLEHVLVNVSGSDIVDHMSCSNKRTLSPDAYNEYVDRAVALVKHWRATYGVNVAAWSLFNEPNFPTDQPTILSPEGHIELTKLFGRALVRENLNTRIFVGDDWTIRHRTLEIAKAVLADAEAREYVAAVGYHSYDGYDFAQQDWREFSEERKARQELAELCEKNGTRVWMTEVSNYRPSTDEWQNVRFRMSEIHDDLVHGRCCAWDFMLAWWQGAWRKNNRGGPQGLAEFFYEPDGTIRRTQLTGTATAIGHWSRAIRPGWQDLKIRCAEENVRCTAFTSPDARSLAIVILQDLPSDAEVEIALPSGQRWNPTGSGFYSNPIERWGDLGPIESRNGTYSFVASHHSAFTLMFSADDR